jgi:hypothetical protein
MCEIFEAPRCIAKYIFIIRIVRQGIDKRIGNGMRQMTGCCKHGIVLSDIRGY